MRCICRRLALVTLALTLLAGCAAVENRARTTLLQQRAKTYVQAIRWGEVDAAARFVRRREGGSPPVVTERLRGSRVTRASYALNAADEEATEVQMTATFEYQPPDSAQVSILRQALTWWYEPELETWFIDGELPQF